MKCTVQNSDFPIFNKIPLSQVFHFGKMDIRDKNTHSHEGNGLSVSLCPFDWMKITKSYSSTTFMVSKDDPLFLDFHSLSDEAINEVIQWGIQNDYIKKIDGFEYTYYNDEFECNLSMKFNSLGEAFEEIGYDIAELDEEEQNSISDDYDIVPCIIYEASNKMSNELGWNPDLSLVETYLITLYTEKVLNYDGVYWDDILDTLRLSAPRGMIFNSKINSFKITKFDTESCELASIVSEQSF